MSDRQYLSEKHCACCGIRLDRLKKRQIQQVLSPALVESINFAKPTIAKRGNKIDNSLVEVKDLVCKRCISIANIYQPKETKTTNKRKRSLSIHRFFTANVKQHESNQENFSSEEKIETIRLNIPRASSSHSCCVIWKSSKELKNIPKEACLDAFTRNNILISKGLDAINIYKIVLFKLRYFYRISLL
jgi:hypothetical protein